MGAEMEREVGAKAREAGLAKEERAKAEEARVEEETGMGAVGMARVVAVAGAREASIPQWGHPKEQHLSKPCIWHRQGRDLACQRSP